jgi:hypothetical protein
LFAQVATGNSSDRTTANTKLLPSTIARALCERVRWGEQKEPIFFNGNPFSRKAS